MSESSFSYVSYIHATAEDVWDGLVNPKLTSRYWFHENVSDWKPGSDWWHKRTDEQGTVDIEGKVLESDEPNRLVVSWARQGDLGDPKRTSRVTFELTPQDDWPLGPWVGLRVEHSELEHDPEMLNSISYGWPGVVSGLKSILERPDIFEIE
ncbi:MAG: SRPBCC domain-containing protein [Candidatus Sulfomarinibacteraceae bacterium]